MHTPKAAPGPSTPTSPEPARQAPDAASSTRPGATKRPVSPSATAESTKRQRTHPQEGTADSLDETAWHSRAWQFYAHGKRASRPDPAPYAWGYPVEN